MCASVFLALDSNKKREKKIHFQWALATFFRVLYYYIVVAICTYPTSTYTMMMMIFIVFHCNQKVEKCIQLFNDECIL